MNIKRILKYNKMIALALIVLAMLFAFPVVSSAATQKTTISITLSSKKLTLKVGESKKLKVKVKGSSAKVTWKSSNTKIASVSSSGTIKGKKAGTATISASVKGVTAKCKVTVKKASTNAKLTRVEAVNAYKKTLKQFAAGKKDSYFSSARPTDQKGYYYLLFDLDGDTIPELLVGKETYMEKYNIFKGYYCLIFTCKMENGTIKVKQLEGEERVSKYIYKMTGVAGIWQISVNGTIMYDTWFNRGTGETDIYQLKLSGDQFLLLYKRTVPWEKRSAFMKTVKEPVWTKISDYSALK